MQEQVMRRSMLIGVIGVLATAFMGLGAYAQEVTLRMVGAFAIGMGATSAIGESFMNNVNRLGKGKVRIRYLGADEVVPPFDQPEALVNGVFDVWYGAPNYWAGVVPGGDITELSTHLAPDGGPGSELYQFMVDLYAEKGVRYLGHAAGSPGVGEHNLNTSFRVTKLEDLKGKKNRTPPLTRHFIQAAGAESITLPPGDVYLAMDRKTVEGFTWPVVDGFTRYGWQTVTKYSVNFPLYRSGGSLAMNLAKWKSLSPEVQDILLKAVAETQAQTRESYAKSLAHEHATMQKAGMELLTLNAEEGKRWKELSENALWQYYKTILPAEKLERARGLLSGR